LSGVFVSFFVTPLHPGLSAFPSSELIQVRLQIIIIQTCISSSGIACARLFVLCALPEQKLFAAKTKIVSCI
jgi:hypothetical protein